MRCWLICTWLFLGVLGPSAAADLLTTAPPLWFDADRPSVQAQQAVQLLLNAADEGLEPQHYQATSLSQAVTRASADPALTPTQQVQLDATLTRAMEHYLSDLSQGRVNPGRVKANFSTPIAHAADIPAWLRDAVREQRLGAAVAQLATQAPMAAPLRQALSHYRALGQHPAWQSPLPALPGRKLEAGQTYVGLPLLAQRLQVLKDLAADTPVPPRLELEGELITALMRFQERHGLTPDGVLGRRTLRQLNITPAQRAEQMALSLERMRWTPLRQAARMVVVNVPEFVLRAYEVQNGKINVKLTMKVIVGKALDTRTPLFDEDMRFIEFSPYWNIPPSIARQETVPKLRADPGYLAHQDMEFVTASGQVVTSMAPDHLDAVLSGSWRIRQRPGPKNALGDIKFVFPNNDNIFLHHTPSPGLFERDRRDFSHGCIRVQEPVALAKFVLQDDPDWPEERIRAAMTSGQSNTLRLTQPVTVLIAYSTVVVKAGRVFFYPDLYGHDRLLAKALRQHAATLTP
ncbi:murein L,D-transpeptidase [Rhodoferax sp.]|uniref:L,D-transpeptidase family protein n=1 Tax=Rhodoferax sp. TaxID=50421 RepID=UPI002731CF81|nr:L,D-transpeptidase family protein [Rhodoferax sp.]MDP1942453.1 L,D-transpeptidase family protein [Rhodoferax sp.]MDP2441913.1 L,D-transpeptidase family protein [Rhodoferax sp.]MDZ4208071.1 L,D-transpeptidase family protein [Rhodoferax sp.]